MELSVSEENHIKTIFHLEHTMGTVTTNALADALRTKPASVTDMLKKLKTKKLLQYQKYQGFTLSADGRKNALQIIRRHRLWEYFLVAKLQFGWDEVHELAEQLEHIRNSKLADRLDEYLGFPALDPHGDPIPDKNGLMVEVQKTAVHQLAEGARGVICSVGDDAGPVMELLQHHQMGIGTRIEVVKKFALDGLVELKISKGKTCTVSKTAAKKIFVHNESIE